MTSRERTALGLVALGAFCALAAGWGYDGARGVIAVLAVLCLLGGVLLGLGDDDIDVPFDDSEPL